MKTVKKIVKRFRESWAVWVSTAGAIWLLLSAFGLPERWGITSEAWNSALKALGVLLVEFGIVNDPTARGEL